MALPPEPIEDVLPGAALVVDAEVSAVLSTGPQPNNPHSKPGATSTGAKSASQKVKLTVTRVLHGSAKVGQELTVEKPEAGYALREGNKGPFLISASNVILGRYGPDTYSAEKLEKALKA